MKTTRLFLFLGFIAIAIATISCQKNGGGTGEANLVVETLPVSNGQVEAPAPGPNFPLIVTVKSTMPSGGVKIDVTAKPDGGTVAFFTNSVTTSSAVTNFSITGSSVGIVSVVNITVTSASTPGNTWTGSYKYSRK